MEKTNSVLWRVGFNKKAAKQLGRLPSESARAAVRTLIEDMRHNGPIRGNWPNFGGMSDGAYHCQLKKGKPTYVCFWKILDKRERIVEVFYVGSHEKAPYPG